MRVKKEEPKVEEFLLKVEAEMDKRNITVPLLADMMGVPRMTVYTWLRRKSIMSLNFYYQIKRILKIKD